MQEWTFITRFLFRSLTNMDPANLKALLQQVKKGSLSVQRALAQLHTLPYENLSFAKIDHHRSLRQGIPEAILCEGKTDTQVLADRGVRPHASQRHTMLDYLCSCHSIC